MTDMAAPVESKFVWDGNEGGEDERWVYEEIGNPIDGSSEMMHDQRSSNQWTNKVPYRLRNTNERAYWPVAVNIGLHGGSMDDDKVNYLHRLLCRTSKSKETLVDDVKQTMIKCVNAMFDEVAKCRQVFPHTYTSDSNRFIAKVMLVDGCFILELVYRSHHEKWSQRIGDPILGNRSLLVDIRRDLLLLENQIPFSALQRLFTLTVEQIHNRHPLGRSLTLTEYIFKFFGSTMNIVGEIKNRDVRNPDHLIDLFHKCYKPSPIINEPADSTEDHPALIKYSATELVRAGVKFHAGERGVLDMSFNTSSIFSWLLCAIIPKQFSSWFFYFCGTTRFQISPLCMDDSTETFLMNLIAYEQSNPYLPQHVTSYAVLMNTLLNSKDDVQVLVKAKVLQNYVGVSEQALQLFNNVCKNVFLQEENLCFSKSCKDLHDYLSIFPDGNFPAKLKRNFVSMVNYFFSSRWAVISIIAALILFALQVLQTVYTIRSSS